MIPDILAEAYEIRDRDLGDLADEETKRCSRCGRNKRHNEFPVDNRNRDKLSSECKACHNRRQARAREQQRIRAKVK